MVGEGRKVGPRLQSFARGLIYLFFAITAVRVAIGANSGSQAQRQELWTAKAMQHTGGRWIVGLVGVVIVICGVVLVMQGPHPQVREVPGARPDESDSASTLWSGSGSPGRPLGAWYSLWPEYS